jgi:gamma-glutamyl:cysteine ligase YbdK (ATP-grasp superfamily)
MHLSNNGTTSILQLLDTFERTRGKEIELHVVHLSDGRRATAEEMVLVWDHLQRKGVAQDTFAKELPHWLIELNSPILRTHAELRSWLFATLDFLREALTQFGLTIMGVDVHPHAWDGHFSLADIPESPTYLRGIWQRMEGRSRPFIGNPFATSGPVTSEQDQYSVPGLSSTQALQLRAQGLPTVPLFTGGTANGPLCVPAKANALEVVDTGLATVRHEWLSVLESFGIGPAFDDEADFVDWLEGEVASGRVEARRAKTYLLRQWRGEHRVAHEPSAGGPRDTHEHREKGAQSRPEDTLAWSAFDQAVYDWIYLLYSKGTPPFAYMNGPRKERAVAWIDADSRTAARDGLEAVITNPFTGDQTDRITVKEGILHLAREVEPLMEAQGLQQELERIHEIANGDAAYLQLRRAFKQGGGQGAIQHLIRSMR